MLSKYIYNGLADFAPMFAGLISAIILTRRFGLYRWGIYSQVLWLVGIVGVFLSFGLTYGTTRYLAQFSGEKKFNELRKTIVFTGSLQLLFSITGAVILFTLNKSLLNWFQWQIDPHYIRIAALGVVSFSLYQYSNFILRGLQLYRLLAIYSGIYAVVLLLIALICLKWPMVEILLIATYLTQLLLLPWIWRNIYRITNFGKSDFVFSLPLEWNGLLRFSIVIYLTMLVDQIVWQRSEIFFLAQLPDAGQAGIYSLAYTVALVGVGVIPSAITGVLTPVFTKEMANKGTDHLREIYKTNFSLLNWLVLPLSIGLFVSAPVLLTDLFGSEFSSASGVLMLLILSSTIAIYSRPSASMLHALNLPKVLLYGSLCALPVDLFLAWRLVPNLGAVGAAAANIVAQTIAGSIAIGYVSLHVKVEYNWKLMGQALIAAIICCSIAWLVMTLIPIPILRICAAAFVGIMVYILVLYKMNEEITTGMVIQIRKAVEKYFTQLSPES